jgi:leader peptidase (prepilin peptidase)/N-methyltransferase
VNPPLIASLALAGLLAGWPQRALIFRYAVPSGEPPRTSCPSCDQQLRLIRRCPACGPPLLAVALPSAILLGALAARVHPGLVLAAVCWLAACAVPLAFIDAAVHRLPDVLTIPAYLGLVALLLWASHWASHWAGPATHWPVLLRAVLGGLALAGFYLIFLLISPSAPGLGDVKLAASLGTVLTWFGWRTLIAGGFAGFLLAGLFGAALLASRRATRKQQIPFGPFMIIGAFLVLLAWPAAGS